MNECLVCETPCEGEYCATCSEWNTIAGGPPPAPLETMAHEADMVATAMRLKTNPRDIDTLAHALVLLKEP